MSEEGARPGVALSANADAFLNEWTAHLLCRARTLVRWVAKMSWIGRCEAVLRVRAAVRTLVSAGGPARGSDDYANLSERAARVTFGALVGLAAGGVGYGRQAYHTCTRRRFNEYTMTNK